MESPQKDLSIKIEDTISKGVYAQKVVINTDLTGVSLTFLVETLDKKNIATGRVFMSHTTAMKMANIILERSGSGYQQYLDWLKTAPSSEDSTSDKEDSAQTQE